MEIQRADFLTARGRQQTELSDSATWRHLIDQRRLQRTMTQANAQVKLLLTLLGKLFEEIIRGCQELEAFTVKSNQGLVDSDMAASMQQKLQKTCQYVVDFQDRMLRNLGQLNLPIQLIPNTDSRPRPQLSVSLVFRMPVMFDRFKSRVMSNTVHLCWEITNVQPKEPDEPFEINVRSLHPTTDGHSQFSKSVCQSYTIQVSNLIPDRYYQFSIKRQDAANLVYGLWNDTIILKTLATYKKGQNVPY